jgi:hypothetical protein
VVHVLHRFERPFEQAHCPLGKQLLRASHDWLSEPRLGFSGAGSEGYTDEGEE